MPKFEQWVGPRLGSGRLLNLDKLGPSSGQSRSTSARFGRDPRSATVGEHRPARMGRNSVPAATIEQSFGDFWTTSGLTGLVGGSSVGRADIWRCSGHCFVCSIIGVYRVAGSTHDCRCSRSLWRPPVTLRSRLRLVADCLMRFRLQESSLPHSLADVGQMRPKLDQARPLSSMLATC